MIAAHAINRNTYCHIGAISHTKKGYGYLMDIGKYGVFRYYFARQTTATAHYLSDLFTLFH